MLGLLIYIGGLSMSFLEHKVKTALKHNSEYLMPFNADILSTIEHSRMTDKYRKTVDAVVLFNWALLHLDVKPKESDREQHVLVGDYLLAEFYKLVIEDNQLTVLNDMMEISKQIHNKKSRYLSENCNIEKSQLDALLYAPLHYLVEHFFLSKDVKRATERHVQQLMQDKMTLRLKEVM